MTVANGNVSVNESSYFQLLNPMMLGLFSLAFVAIWRVDRATRATLMFAAAYGIGAIGFTLDFFLRDAVGPLMGPYISNLPFLVALALTAAAFHMRYAVPVPWISICMAAIGTVTTMSMFVFTMSPTPVAEASRMLVINFGAGLVFAYTLRTFTTHLRLHDIVLRFLAYTFTFQFVVRPIAVLAYTDGNLDRFIYSDTPYALALHLSAGVISLCIGATLVFAHGTELVERLARDGLIDPLTGLLNRRGLDRRLKEMEGRAGPAAVVIADIDHFKLVNDRHGHAAGDRVIEALAKIMGAGVSDGAAVARTGGEEFVAVLANAPTDVARLYAEGVRTAFAAAGLDAVDRERLTVSLGVASWLPDETMSDAFARADAALYRAKELGRDRVALEERLEPDVALGEGSRGARPNLRIA